MVCVYLTNHAVERLSKRFGMSIDEADRQAINQTLTQDAQSWPNTKRANIELAINGQTLYAVCVREQGRWAVVTITTTVLNAPRGKRRKRVFR
jgi:hypothetical protein